MRVVLTGLAAVAIAGGVVGAPADPAGVAREVSQRQTAFNGPYADDLRFRTSAGFSTDPAVIALARREFQEAREAGGPPVARFGVPLTREELAELDAREASSRDDAPVVREWFATQHPELFGGLYVARRIGGGVTVCVTRDVERVTRELRAIVKHPERLTVRKVRYSRNYLGWVQMRMREYGFSIGVRSSSVSVERNLVEVGALDVELARRALPLIVPADVIEVEYAVGVVGLTG